MEACVNLEKVRGARRIELSGQLMYISGSGSLTRHNFEKSGSCIINSEAAIQEPIDNSAEPANPKLKKMSS